MKTGSAPVLKGAEWRKLLNSIPDRRSAILRDRALIVTLTYSFVEAPDDIGGGAMIRGDDLPQIFRVESRRERRRADEIAEHHRQLPAFGVDWRR